MSEKQKAEQKLVEVTLLKPHTHAGVPHAAGAKLKVNEPTRDWLATNQIIETTKEAVAK